MNEHFPKILVLNAQCIYKNNATGITLRSIIREIPDGKLLELYRDNTTDMVEERFNFSSIQIPAKDMPINYIIRKIMGLSNDYENSKAQISKNIDDNSSKNISNRKRFVLFFKALLESSYIHIDKELDRKIKEFKPDVIYTLGASEYVLTWAVKLQKKYKTRVVLHYMDNWRETQYGFGKCGLLLKKMQDKKISYLESKMRYGLTISEAMADAYHQKYGSSYLTLMNVAQNMDIFEKNSEEVIFIYAGGLHLGRDSCIKKIASILEEKASYGLNVKLIVYTDPQYWCLFDDSPFVEVREPVKHEEIDSVYNLADVLIHAESDSEEYIDFTKYSMSTKISEYMMSGKPILCYAPKCLASAKYIAKYHAGVCVDNENDLRTGIDILMNKNNRNKFGDNGRKCAGINHSIEHLRTTINTVFCEGTYKIYEQQD